MNSSNDGNDNISLNLGENTLVLKDTGDWAFQSTDLDAATFEIEKLVEDKETLTSSLSSCLNQIENLRSEIVDVNHMKSVILEMLMAERQKNLQLESELDGYKEELKESFRVIVELRKLVQKQ